VAKAAPDTRGDVVEMRGAVRDFLPALDGELLEATPCLYTLTPDLNFGQSSEGFPRHDPQGGDDLGQQPAKP